MNKDQKSAVVEEIAGQIRDAQAIYALDYRGLTVAQAAELRVRLRDSDTRFRVVKNSLSERAADAAGAEVLKPLLVGPTALALVGGDAALAAKALNDAARAFNVLEFKGGVLDGGTLSADEVRAIARLPAREVLHAQLVGTIAAPITGLVRTLNALIAGLAIQLKAIADQGLVSGEAPAAPAEAEPPAEAEAPADAEAPAEAEAPAAEVDSPATPTEAEAPTPAAEPEPAAPEVETAPSGAEALPAEPTTPAEPEAQPSSEEPEADAADADPSEA